MMQPLNYNLSSQLVGNGHVMRKYLLYFFGIQNIYFVSQMIAGLLPKISSIELDFLFIPYAGDISSFSISQSMMCHNINI